MAVSAHEHINFTFFFCFEWQFPAVNIVTLLLHLFNFYFYFHFIVKKFCFELKIKKKLMYFQFNEIIFRQVTFASFSIQNN